MLIARRAPMQLAGISAALPIKAPDIHRTSVRHDITAQLPGGVSRQTGGEARRGVLPGVHGAAGRSGGIAGRRVSRGAAGHGRLRAEAG
ncbi:hypothetical protein DFR52_102121 [Hoeflea marina]|uniref:Uncharacterized protein n=1 Tax=Hoeflea marina TaxID=274592 RepID=A0A317PMG2_9HYPH|nr:hypothetical protein [Hoeflea marina]PWW01459.1 hypothetical protein DFR52_102121 [Hoeflea marina]